MANIDTAFFRLYSRGDWQQAHLSRKRLLKTLFESNFFKGSYSYWVPAWSRRVSPRIIEIQGGFKIRHISGALSLWERFGDRLEAMWIRHVCADANPDWIYHFDHEEGGSDSRVCRYGCDRVKITWRPEAPLHLQNQRTFSFRGTYLAENDRSYFRPREDEPPLMRTPTTPTSPHGRRRFAWEMEEAGLPADLAALEPAIDKYAARVEVFWQKRLVQCWVPWKTTWLLYPVDGWDNCVDEGWLRWVDEHG